MAKEKENCNTLWWSHTGLTPLIPTLWLFFYFFTLSSYAPYIVDCMYIHVNPRVLLKTAKVNKELYLSSLIVSPSKKHKQDRINPPLLFLTLYSHYGLAIGLGGCTSWVGCWVVTIINLHSIVWWISHQTFILPLAPTLLGSLHLNTTSSKDPMFLEYTVPLQLIIQWQAWDNRW